MSKQIKYSILVQMIGYGHYKVGTSFRGKMRSTITTNTLALDDWNSEDDEKDGKESRKLRGYRALRAEIISRFR